MSDSAHALGIAEGFRAVARAVPERECIVWKDRRLSFAAVDERTDALARLLLDHGVGSAGVRDDVAPWESGHDHVALYMTNANEYLEGMLGAYKARVAPFNVNYRYVAEELVYLFTDAMPRAIIFHARYGEVLRAVLDQRAAAGAPEPLLLQVADESDAPLLPGALDLDDALATAARSTAPLPSPSPDDLYVVYTGGTTGYPKGALWRQVDFLASALGLRASPEALAETAPRSTLRALPAPPLMHGAAHWNALSCFLTGGTVILQDHADRFDPHDVLATIERERATSLLIVGDAFARPLLEAQRAQRYDLSTLRHLISGGAIFNAALKQAWVDEVPSLRIVDILGSSESGRQGVASGSRPGPAAFTPAPTAVVLAEALDRRLGPDDAGEIGWLAQTGPMPRGYLGDRTKTERTFPTIDGERYAVAGDRARVRPDGSIELLGRESVTINTGGEKVFAEEVEHALKHHPDVLDVLVVGRPSEQWGQEVVAVAHLRPGAGATDDDLRDVAAEHIARYKLPKAVVRVAEIARSPSGKPDYAWATRIAADT